MGDKKKEFVTGDLWLASALTIILKAYPVFSVKNGKVLFKLPDTTDTYRAIAEYNSNSPLPAFEYSQTVKRLRGEMIKRKGEMNSVTRNQTQI